MSPSRKQRLPLEQAHAIAQPMREYLLESCRRVEIAGSIRRRESYVGDIEMVCMTEPYRPQEGMLGVESGKWRTAVDDALGAIGKTGWVLGEKNGLRAKQLVYTTRGLTADVYIVLDERAWGSMLCARTGPWWFSKSLMSRAHALGMHFADGFLLHNHRHKCDLGSKCPDIVSLPEEIDVFAALEMAYLEPTERGSGIKQ